MRSVFTYYTMKFSFNQSIRKVQTAMVPDSLLLLPHPSPPRTDHRTPHLCRRQQPFVFSFLSSYRQGLVRGWVNIYP
jgi:hypothetical protein